MIAKLRRFIHMRIPGKLTLLSTLLLRFKAVVYYRHVFGSFGRGSVLGKPVLLTNPHFMHIGDNVLIRTTSRLEAIACDSTYEPELRIGNNVNIEHFVQMSAIGRLIIGHNVTIGSRTMILCGSHPFRDVRNPVKVGDRIAGKNSFIEIGEGTLIGSGVAILQNVRIGKRSIIGANSVVNTNIPDFCVALGNPAVVVMRYDETQDCWMTIER